MAIPALLEGVGIGLRAPHVSQILKFKPQIDWLELLADNHICDGGWARRQAIEVARHYPLTMHCVGMSIGSVDPIDFDYLKKIKDLANEIKPKLISDHLCWTSLNAHYSHDLLPLPYTQEALDHLSDRIMQIQDYLGVQIAIENISAYLTYKHSTIDECEFINALAEKADCFILFDLNNVYVNQVNNGQSVEAYMETINTSRVAEIHLAGFEEKENYLLDAHNNCVHEDVWGIYQTFISKNPNIPTLIEWDHDLPELSVLTNEALKARTIIQNNEAKNEFLISG